MKKTFGLLTALSIGLALPQVSLANEGNISLSNPSVSCQGVSLWNESAYKVNVRCNGLVYPYQTQYEHYVAWARLENGNFAKIGEIDRGYFDGNVPDNFSSVIVTAESEGNARKPSDKQILSGDVTPFSFDKSKTTTETIQPAVTPAPGTVKNGTTVVQEAVSKNGASVGSVIGSILKSLLIIVGVIIVLAVGASLVFRKRGSVSA
ncbi:MAG: hypothetical protein UY18_C0011G0003 [Microgenomates group bacterium GW2011_GWF2_47_9]|nr:MAG: hypothetical protein UY18_C0011G0003 [Microgenomates group bacterium GW2011_GWF2_47_9]